MNANHARPLAAFWLLAIAAAVITGAGLRASQSPGPVATPAPVISTPAPELVLGGVLQARTGQALLHPLAPGLWAVGSAGSSTTATVQVASPGGPATTYKARTGGTGAPQGTKVQAHASATSTSSTAQATATGAGHGKGLGKGDHPGGPTTTVTATATPTDPGKSPGGGGGQGPSSGHGR